MTSSSPAKRPRGLALEVMFPRFGICRLGADAPIPDWARGGSLVSVTRTGDELSILCEQDHIPEPVRCERDWRAIRVLGPLDFSLIGVLESLARPLTRARISIFALSTFDTDYLLVRHKNLAKAIRALRDAGHSFDLKPPYPTPVEVEKEPPETGDEAVEPTGEVDETDEPAAEPPPEMPALSPPSPVVLPREDEPEPLPELSAADEERSGRRARELAALEAEYAPRRERRLESAPAFPEPEGEPPAEEPGERPSEPAFDEEPEEEPAFAEPGFEPRPEREPRRRGTDDEELDVSDLFTGAIPQHPVETVEGRFADLGLSPAILATVADVGFENPTPVQAAVIPIALAGHDVVGLAETGSGKTAAFCLPMAEHLTHGRGIRGLILCPTREIALQTKAFLEIFGRDHALETVAVIGGVKMGPQIDGFRRVPDILVATPGRLADHMRRGNVSLERIEKLVLDEADHMLDLGFLPQIQEILEQIPLRRQTMMFSATMPPPIERLSQVFMKDPQRVDLRPDGQAAAGIEHRLYLVREEDKKRCLLGLLRDVPGSTLIFVRRKLHTEWLARQIELHGVEVERIHSDRTQGQRVEALKGFRQGHHRVLVATDVAARGLDIPEIRHVINFELPDQVEDYIHRAGRTARGQAKGIVSSIATWKEKEQIRMIESALEREIPRCSVSGVEAYVEAKPRKTIRRRLL